MSVSGKYALIKCGTINGMSISVVTDTDIPRITALARDIVQDWCSRSGEPRLLLVSGGSALSILGGVFVEHAEDLAIGVVDERYSQNLLDNNFLQLKKTSLYMSAIEAGATDIDTSPSAWRTREELVEIMNTAIRKWIMANQDGKVYVVLGVGIDGHTAGIIPLTDRQEEFDKLFDTKDVWVVGYDSGSGNSIPERVTVTLSFLRDMVDEAVVYVVGENKKQSVVALSHDDGSLVNTPARIVKEMKSATLFTTLSL